MSEKFIFWFCVVFVLGAVSLGMWGCPSYNVWSAQKKGQAEFARAVANRKILIEEARSQLVADSLLAEAEVIRAIGAKRAMEEEGGALTPMYIRYLWVRKLDLSGSETIYIPTESGLPITESVRNFDYDEMWKRQPK